MANLQTILVPINKFTLTQAIAWVKHHSYKYEKVDIKSKYYRLDRRLLTLIENITLINLKMVLYSYFMNNLLKFNKLCSVIQV